MGSSVYGLHAPGTESCVIHATAGEVPFESARSHFGGCMNVEEIARVCHEVNRAYCQALGDTSQPRWDEAPQWQKDSVILGVEFHLKNPAAGPEASHESWLAQKKKDGWVYGPKKDVEKKEHPCCVPFDWLSKEQQTKDFIFTAIVHALGGAQ